MSRRLSLAGYICLLGLIAQSSLVYTAHAQNDKNAIKELQKRELDTLDEASKRQKRIDALDDETRKAAAKYSHLSKRLEQLKNHKAQLMKLQDSQTRELASIEKQLKQVPTIEQNAFPLMQKMVASLEAFIRADQPFHLEARLTKVEELKNLMDRADVTAAEKMRKIFSLYKREMEYGRTIEAYEANLFPDRELLLTRINRILSRLSSDAEPTDEDNQPEKNEDKTQVRLVTFMRYGRLALIYQTFDQSETGIWDKATNSWKPLDGKLAREVRSGIAIAFKRVPPDMLIVPVIKSKGAK